MSITVKVKEVLQPVRGSGKLKKSNYQKSGSFPVIDQGNNVIAGFTDQEELLIRAPLPLIVFGDHTRALKLVKEPFVRGADGTQLIYPKPTMANPVFFYYALKNLNLSNYHYARHFKFLKEEKIDLPALDNQRKIAEVLEAYDNLIDNNSKRIEKLEAMGRLLYKNEASKVATKTTLGSKVIIKKGKNITKATIRPGNVPVVAGGLQPAYYHDTPNTVGPVITISASGANAGYTNIYYENIWASDCSYIDASATPHTYFFYTLLRDMQYAITHMQKGSAQPHVYPEDLKRLEIPDFSDTQMEILSKQMRPIYDLIGILKKKNDKLGRTRDSLLPRLLSGEVIV